MTGGVRAAPRRILLADVDAFYVAVARRVDPEGAGRARLLIVGGAAESRGVVCSASYETRLFGVRSAMPTATALRLCPGALCVPIPRRACAEASRAVQAVLERFTPVVEAASIDEWFLDLGGTSTLYRGEPLAATGQRIRAAVSRETGLSISVGGGTSKLVAKLAVQRAKPSGADAGSGVHVVQPGAEAEFLAGLALGDLPQVGPRLQQRLAELGLRDVSDVLRRGTVELRSALGDRLGAWLHERASGRDADPVRPRLRAVSISRDETFAADLDADEDLERELLRLVVRAASDLRGQGLDARTVTVRIRDADFRRRQASRTLARGVGSERVVYSVARDLLRRLRQARRMPARLLGVALSSLSSGAEAPGLFADDRREDETPRERALSRAVDALRAKYGPDGVLPGGLHERAPR
ncbi:MAG: DNA polymerase IV [Gemmatimonadota bacterium]